MEITQFEITNFKGIASTTIQIADSVPGNVTTLIGLNESGKTTILEALSNFVTEDKDTAGLVRTVSKGAAIQDLIPKDKKAAFTGRTSIKATVRFDEADVSELADFYLKKHSLILDTASLAPSTVVEKAYEFVDSNLTTSMAYWTLSLGLRSKSQRKFKYHSGRPHEDKKIWLEGVAFLRERLPKIVYFPTFLFDFPDRIYLEDDDSEINSYYKQVIQDVLDCQGEGLELQKHIIDRISKVRDEHETPATFLGFFFQRDEKKQIDAVLQKASNEMSNVIFGSWNQILGRNVTGKRVQVDWLLDGERNNAPYLEVSIVDGQSKYSLSERSLGFRWFFSFLLFTQFRKSRRSDSPTLFLFDEPAANLHSKAQMKLLETFSKIGKGATHIIYSTHSHYMVNPMWLEKAYIVQNKATDYDNEDQVDSFSFRKTDISAVKYRTFVGSYPTKTTYFQPVLDALDIPFSPLIHSTDALIVEGKNDFYAIKYLRACTSACRTPDIFPGTGAGNAEDLISLFRGWGVKFRILLDDDKAGRAAKKKYREMFLLSDVEVQTIGDIDPTLQGKALEGLYQDDVLDAVKKKFSTGQPTKQLLALYFQELLTLSDSPPHPDTVKAFIPLSNWIDSQFSEEL